MRALVPVFSAPTGLSSSGFPYLDHAAFQVFRDTVPHLLGQGHLTLLAAQALRDGVRDQSGLTDAQRESFERAFKVVRSMVYTAVITAPSDLWLLRIIMGSFVDLGLQEQLLDGAVLSGRGSVDAPLDPRELQINVQFLRSRAMLARREPGYGLGGSPSQRDTWSHALSLPESWVMCSALWIKAFQRVDLSPEELAVLEALMAPLPLGDARSAGWSPDWADIELGFRMIGIVLGVTAAGHSKALQAGDATVLHGALGGSPLEASVLAFFDEVGFTDGGEVTDVGRRGFARGPAPYGIIDSYRPYMARTSDALRSGSTEVWVERTANVAASQDANRRTFIGANDALDAFCAKYDFSYQVFIEHAMGRGEAIRQRWGRSGGSALSFFGADLEDPSIDAAIKEQSEGHLPANLTFIRNADIGRPEVVGRALEREGALGRGAVMMVGNGFHEIRNQTDERMVSVFQGYHDAGFILLFTEASALSVADLLETAYNTYHAGFKYVHEKSGQGLRPAYPVPASKEHSLRASWNGCATRAGYVRVDEFCHRSRTIYPYNPPDRHNPAISVTHFFIPGWLATELGVSY